MRIRSEGKRILLADVARVRGEGHVVRVRLERPSDNASFGQTEAGVEMTQGVAGVCRAECCTVLRSRWYQNGVNSALVSTFH